MTYALDTNAVIDFLNQEPLVVKRFYKVARDGINIVIPSIVDYEILRGFFHTPSSRKEAAYNIMRLNCPIIEININIWKQAASIWAVLRKSGLTIGDADILIAAYCVVNDFTLVTCNTKDFDHIRGLKLVNWKSHDKG